MRFPCAMYDESMQIKRTSEACVNSCQFFCLFSFTRMAYRAIRKLERLKVVEHRIRNFHRLMICFSGCNDKNMQVSIPKSTITRFPLKNHFLIAENRTRGIPFPPPHLSRSIYDVLSCICFFFFSSLHYIDAR